MTQVVLPERDTWTADKELHLVRKVQAGDVKAYQELEKQYFPMLKGLARSVNLPYSDALAVAQTYFYLSIMDHDQGRLGKYKYAIRDALLEETASTARASIPPRTLSRYYFIMDRADYDVVQACAIAREYGMDVTTLLHIRSLLNSDYADLPPEYLSIPDEDSGELAHHALGVCDTDERSVIECAYMADVAPRTDGTVAYLLACLELGESKAKGGQRRLSFWAVRRLREAALKRMREVLGAQ